MNQKIELGDGWYLESMVTTRGIYRWLAHVDDEGPIDKIPPPEIYKKANFITASLERKNTPLF